MTKKWMCLTIGLLCALAMTGCAQAGAFVQMVEETFVAEESDAAPKVPSIRSGRANRAHLKPVEEVGELVSDPVSDGSGNTSRGAKPNVTVELDAKPKAASDVTISPEHPATVTTVPQFPWDESLLPYRSLLSKEDRLVYDEIYANVSKMTSRFPLVNKTSPRSISNIVRAVIYDHPDLFWLDSSYRFGYTSKGVVTDVQISFNSTAANISQAKKQFESAAEAILRKAVLLPNDWEKEKYVHDYLLDHVNYDISASNNQSAYSALVDGKSVCAGYAKAFQYIMMKLGIPCYYCVGYAGEDHAWNLIKLDGKFYNVDVAWDDPEGNTVGTYYYDYFNLSDKAILKDHRRTEMAVYLPVAMETADRPAA